MIWNYSLLISFLFREFQWERSALLTVLRRRNVFYTSNFEFNFFFSQLWVFFGNVFFVDFDGIFHNSIDFYNCSQFVSNLSLIFLQFVSNLSLIYHQKHKFSFQNAVKVQKTHFYVHSNSKLLRPFKLKPALNHFDHNRCHCAYQQNVW